MLKAITISILLIAFTSQTFYKAFIVFDYVANTRAYARFCENKNRPKLHCNGKCQMMKKIREEEKKDAQNAERKSENKNENILQLKSFHAFFQFIYSDDCKLDYPEYISGNIIKMPRSYFHPPSCS